MPPDSVVKPPSRPAERIELLDALRGLAIFGILVMNLYFFSGWLFLPAFQKAALAGSLDHAAIRLHEVFVHGKFYTIFSLLFGIGFALQFHRASGGDRAFVAFYRRRLWILLAIGVVHLALLWQGDILTVYALCGFALIPFRRARDRTLLVSAAVLLVMPVLVYAVMVASGGRFEPGAPFWHVRDALWARLFAPGTTDIAIMTGGSWRQFFEWNLVGVFDRLGGLLHEGRFFRVMGVFLLGLWTGRRLCTAQSATRLAILRPVFVLGIVVGIPGNVLLMRLSGADIGRAPSMAGLLEVAVYAAVVVPLGLAYCAGFAMLWGRGHGERWLSILAPAGRMALTNYLAQTLVGLSLYGIGFGFDGRIGPAQWTALAVLVFALQVALSSAWLRYFRFGPVEWLWRSLAYRHLLPLRSKARGVRQMPLSPGARGGIG